MTASVLARPDYRFRLYRRLQRRNRVVGVLRIAVPVLGALLLAYLVVQITIANMAEGLSVSSVTFSRQGVIIEAPSYAGIMANGSTYELVASKATASFANTDILALDDARLEVVRPDGVHISAFALRANYDMMAQTVDVPGHLSVEDSRNIRAVATQALIDWRAQRVTAEGPVAVTFADGTKLNASGLVFEGDAARWNFTNAVLETPDAANVRRSTQ